jgi:hypothetical protein
LNGLGKSHILKELNSLQDNSSSSSGMITPGIRTINHRYGTLSLDQKAIEMFLSLNTLVFEKT